MDGARWSRRLSTLAALLLPLTAPSTAYAWASVEHQEIGSLAYRQACAALAARQAGPVDPPRAQRLARVCGPNQPVLAKLYGDATAIAGDFLDHPSEFLSQAGAWRFRSKKSYYLLALENSEHFNPTSLRSWAEYHQRAIDYALSGAANAGLPSVEALQLAIYESAFADHYLQDSFAAGHMGFNRRASSAAAAKSFHDAWNSRGRTVTDRAGDRWVTYGDGHLDEPANAAGRQHVMQAAALSIGGVLAAFVAGTRTPADEIAVWQLLPFTIEAPEVSVEMVDIFTRENEAHSDRDLVPLDLTIRPAQKDVVFTAASWTAAPFDDAGHPVVAVVGGLELAIPYVPAQTYLGAGGAVREPNGHRAAVIDTGLLFPIGIGLSGLLSYQLNTTASWLVGNGFSVVLHADLQLNAELGDVLVSLHGGLAELLPDAHTGYFGAIGVGYVFSAAGGGVL
ncbi:MAG TPA: hypothetical protein VHG72_22135 [Polyangia bacterium]|nr:hypothetical protein [Polyangia bacterium]